MFPTIAVVVGRIARKYYSIDCVYSILGFRYEERQQYKLYLGDTIRYAYSATTVTIKVLLLRKRIRSQGILEGDAQLELFTTALEPTSRILNVANRRCNQSGDIVHHLGRDLLDQALPNSELRLPRRHNKPPPYRKQYHTSPHTSACDPFQSASALIFCLPTSIL